MWKEAFKIVREDVAWVFGSAAFGTVTALIIFLIVPEDKLTIPGRWAGLFIIVGLFLVAVIVRLVIRLSKRRFSDMHDIIITKTIASKDDYEIFCLLRYNPVFSHGTITSIYYTDEEDFEILIGFGHVTYIRENKYIQVQIDAGVNPHQKLIEGLQKNDVTVLNRVTMKPHVPLLAAVDLYAIGAGNER